MSERRSVAEISRLLAGAHGAQLERLVAEFADDERAGVCSACAIASRRAEAERAEAARIRKLYELQRTLAAEGYAVVAGVDEVGRGALAGPLTAAAVVLALRPRIPRLDDSKRLAPAAREEIAAVVREQAVAVSVAHIAAEEIDALGVTAALKRVMLAALAGLTCQPDHVVIDGLPLRIVEHETAVVKGDSKVAAIAAASIVAKVERDALMRAYAAEHPSYGFEINKGYGTPEHLDAINRFGPCYLHRRSFSAGGGTLSLF